MKFNIREIKRRSRENFQRAWVETAEELSSAESEQGISAGYEKYMTGTGKEHEIQTMIHHVRGLFVGMGFEEVENQIFIPVDDIYKQYGPETPVILDRCYFLAGLPRPDIGLSDEKISEIKKIAPFFSAGKFKGILRGYREGKVEGDDMIEVMVKTLKITTQQATEVLDLFPEFRDITPEASDITLRSHMTAGWFPTLSAVQHRKMPIRLFSCGLRFRREQKLDATHLRAHYGASCVIMDPDISLDTGNKISEKILGKLNFTDFGFVKKKATSNYYAEGMEYEVYSEGIEIADCGMYSPVACANYDIQYPVYNLGFGIERILMIKSNYNDVRSVMYPQFYSDLKLDDGEISQGIEIAESPQTEIGREISQAIAKAARENSDAKSPCRFEAYSGKFFNKNIKVYVTERESNTMLLGPAALNEIYVSGGSIYGIPQDPSKLSDKLIDIRENSKKANFSYIDALGDFFAHGIEQQVTEGQTKGFIQVKMAKSPADLNIYIKEYVRRFITAGEKKIMLKGPVFMGVEFEVTESD